MALHKGGPIPLAISAAFGQSTPAMQAKISGARGGRRSAASRAQSRSRISKSSRKKRTSSKKRSRAGSAARVLKKGSAAAKKWGKKMAALRKRRR